MQVKADVTCIKLAARHKRSSVDTSPLAGASAMDPKLTSPPAQPDQDAFPFLKLPPEIRIMVYKELASAGFLGWESAMKRLSHLQDQPISRPEDCKPEPHSTPAILLVNRLIYQEAVSVLYSTVFELHEPISAMKMKRFFCKGFFQQLQHVTLNADMEKNDQDYLINVGITRPECIDMWYEMTIFLLLVWHEKHNLQHLRAVTTANTIRYSTSFEDSQRSDPTRHAWLTRMRNHIFPVTALVENVSIEGCSSYRDISGVTWGREMSSATLQIEESHIHYWKLRYPTLQGIVEGWSS